MTYKAPPVGLEPTTYPSEFRPAPRPSPEDSGPRWLWGRETPPNAAQTARRYGKRTANGVRAFSDRDWYWLAFGICCLLVGLAACGRTPTEVAPCPPGQVAVTGTAITVVRLSDGRILTDTIHPIVCVLRPA